MKAMNMRYHTAGKRSQQGLTLLVALIMLVMVTLLAASAFKTSNTNLKVVSSMQGRQEAVASAQAAIERVISTAFFTEEPAVVAATPIAGAEVHPHGAGHHRAGLDPYRPALRGKRPGRSGDSGFVLQRHHLGNHRQHHRQSHLGRDHGAPGSGGPS